MNKFMFGGVYEEITNEMYDEKVKTSSAYEVNKDTYLNENYDNVETKSVYWTVYVKNILYVEKSFNKDLFEFNIEELNSLLSSVASNSISVKSQVFSFCEQYIDWNIDKGRISINQMRALDKDKILKVGKKSARKQMIGLKNFYVLLIEIENKLSLQHAVVYLLARYGLQGDRLSEIINFRLKDIDRENMLIYVYSEEGEIVKQLPIDEEFIRWCDKIYQNDDGRKEENIYVKNQDFLIKLKEGSKVEDVKSAIYNRILTTEKESGINLKISNLNKSRKIELLLEIRKDRLLTTGDFADITTLFTPTATVGAYDILVKYYKSISNDEVVGRNKVKFRNVSLEDPNGEEFVRNLKEEIGF